MSSGYKLVVEHLKEYRVEHNMSQQQLSKLFGVTQSHYAKLEAGTKIVSFQSLKHFENAGGDVYYLITGNLLCENVLKQYFDLFETEEGKKRFFEILVWFIERGIDLCCRQGLVISDITYKNVKLLKNYNKGLTIWENIRQNEKISQIEMSEIFDINVKRYRRIEKLYVQPNAEILNTLYFKLHYSPMLILDRELFYFDEVNRIWEEFPDGVKKILLPSMNEIIKLINTLENYDEKYINA